MSKPDLRKSSAVQRLALKAAFDRAVDLAGGPASFQHSTRVVVGHLSKYASPQDALFPPIDVVLDADLQARDPVVLRALAIAEGYSLVANKAAADDQPWSAEMGDLARETGDLLARIGLAAVDGIDHGEAAACLVEAYDAKKQLDDIVLRLERIIGGPAVPAEAG